MQWVSHMRTTIIKITSTMMIMGQVAWTVSCLIADYKRRIMPKTMMYLFPFPSHLQSLTTCLLSNDCGLSTSQWNSHLRMTHCSNAQLIIHSIVLYGIGTEQVQASSRLTYSPQNNINLCFKISKEHNGLYFQAPCFCFLWWTKDFLWK